MSLISWESDYGLRIPFKIRFFYREANIRLRWKLRLPNQFRLHGLSFKYFSLWIQKMNSSIINI